MYENKISFKLINITLMMIIVFLLYSIKGLWVGVVSKLFEVLLPFILGFACAYAIYPFCEKLQDRGIPKCISIFMVIFITLGFIALMFVMIVPLVYDQVLLFLSNISAFITDISSKYELNLGILQTSVTDISTKVITRVGTNLSDGAINILNTGINVITSIVIIVCVSIYFLIDMDKIRKYLRTTLKRINKKLYSYVKCVDIELKNYLSGLGKNILIQLFEYTIVFFLIGHPNYLILGILAAVTTIIPYFGGLIINIIALLIASVISSKLFIATLIVCLVCPNIDGYIIGPKIYGKTNKIHPIVNIFAVFAGGLLGGFLGILVSLPLAIVIITTYKYFEDDIYYKITGKRKRKTKNMA